MFEECFRFDEGTVTLRHLFPVDGQEAMNMDFLWQVEIGNSEHGRPEQRMKVGNVLSDEMMYFRIWIFPPSIKVFTGTITILFSGSHIADGCIKPHKPKVAGSIRNFKTEIRLGSRDIPIPKRLVEKVPFEIVGDFGL